MEGLRRGLPPLLRSMKDQCNNENYLFSLRDPSGRVLQKPTTNHPYCIPRPSNKQNIFLGPWVFFYVDFYIFEGCVGGFYLLKNYKNHPIRFFISCLLQCIFRFYQLSCSINCLSISSREFILLYHPNLPYKIQVSCFPNKPLN